MIKSKKNKKFFLITIDTEGDNQWSTDEIETKNVAYLPRFQELAEKYDLKPTWLVNYEMANDKNFVKYFKKKQKEGMCEIGMHLHAWNNPPIYNLPVETNAKPYITEYPKEVMNEKVEILTQLITKKFGVKPISHRSGRWALSSDYLEVLKDNGYKIDCTVTPLISWENNLGRTGKKGNDYSSYPMSPYFISNEILEVPVSIRKVHYFKRFKSIKQLLGSLKWFIIGKSQMLRPDKFLDERGLNKLINICDKNGEYLMFMIHSSELMPNGSPNFCSEESIEKLYGVIENIFKKVIKKGYIGVTLKEFSEVGFKHDNN